MMPDLPNLRIPSDLSGVTVVRYPQNPSRDLIEAELGPACRAVRRVIEQLGRKNDPDLELTDEMVLLLKMMMESRMLDSDTIALALAAFNWGIDIVYDEARFKQIREQIANHTDVALDDEISAIRSALEALRHPTRKREYNAWDKAGQFCLHHLLRCGLAWWSAGRAVSGVCLTKGGEELVTQDYFKERLQRIYLSDPRTKRAMDAFGVES
jgi:hypothetical protein